MNAEKLNDYRKTLEKRMNWVRVTCLAYLLLGGLRRFLGPDIGDSLALAMLMGAMMGGMLVVLLSSFRFRRALQDDKKLLRLYNQEHDERTRAIRAKAGMPVVAIYAILLMAAAIVASFFDIRVTVTLVVVAVAQMLLSCALKFWYMRRM